MIVELLQPCGPDLARRWLAALLLVTREDRATVVATIEQQIVKTYADPAPASTPQVVTKPLTSAPLAAPSGMKSNPRKSARKT